MKNLNFQLDAIKIELHALKSFFFFFFFFFFLRADLCYEIGRGCEKFCQLLKRYIKTKQFLKEDKESKKIILKY